MNKTLTLRQEKKKELKREVEKSSYNLNPWQKRPLTEIFCHHLVSTRNKKFDLNLFIFIFGLSNIAYV